MGAWSVSITGNDTAADLKSEYQAAFCYYDIETALQKIDNYVRKNFCDENDETEWSNYYYSLANFMWSKGMLTDAVKEKTLKMIDSDFGMELWSEDAKTLESRKKALHNFRYKITSPQPPKKKIKVNLYIKPIFEIGDVITFQLQTLDKIYVKEKYNISEEYFRSLHGKYIAFRKIINNVSYVSEIAPEVRDIWPVFQLYDKIFDEIPTLEEVIGLNVSKIKNGMIITAGSLFYFRKRNYVVLGNHQDNAKKLYDEDFVKLNYISYSHIIFGANNDCYNPDKHLISLISL